MTCSATTWSSHDSSPGLRQETPAIVCLAAALDTHGLPYGQPSSEHVRTWALNPENETSTARQGGGPCLDVFMESLGTESSGNELGLVCQDSCLDIFVESLCGESYRDELGLGCQDERGHECGNRKCRPCTFHHRKRCVSGSNCHFCHLCKPYQSEKKKVLSGMRAGSWARRAMREQEEQEQLLSLLGPFFDEDKD